MTSITVDDIIYELQAFGGARDFWEQLTRRLDADPRLDVTHTSGRSLARVLPVRATTKVLHSSHFRVPLRRSTKCVSTIHDLTYELGHVHGKGRLLNLWERRRAVQRADAIVCISTHTRDALAEHYSSSIRSDVPIVTIPHGRTYRAPTGAPLPDSFQRGRGYVLHVGNRRGYKNFSTALRAYARSSLVKDGIQLWCTGSHFSPDEIAEIEQVGVDRESVRDIGFVDSATLGLLYEHAIGLVYPSSYEGFGLPPLDAMSLGCPVIASDNSSVPEVVGNAGLLVDPTDIEGFTRSMDALLDLSVTEELRQAGRTRALDFDWRRAADDHAALYLALDEQ
jgi:glycosyltransferase involved in cell wall biosynthesis